MIFLGPLFQKEQELELLSKIPFKSIQNQVNNFEWNLINGFRENGKSVKIINVLPVGTYPKAFSQWILNDYAWGEKHQNHEVGSVNLPFIKQFIRYKKVKKLLADSEDTDIVIYSTYLPFLKAVYHLGKNFNITLIVTDLPEYYDLGHICFLKKVLRKWNNKRIYHSLKRVDKYVLLTEQMKYPLKIGNTPYVIVEGIADSNIVEVERQLTDKFIVTYAGTLNAQFGIRNLVDAFCLIDNPNIELHLFGNGDEVEYIKQLKETHSNIVFHGFIPKQEMEKFYQKTNLLVNPRQNIGEYTKYSFPSKTMEYLASGIPVLMYKLSGIPDEYDAYLNYVSDNSVQALADKIVEIYNDNTGKFTAKALEGKRFVEMYKNTMAQARKIIEMMDDNKNIV